MNKAEIKKLIDDNCLKAIRIQNESDDVMLSRHADMVYEALDFLREVLVADGVRFFKNLLKDFDAVDYLRKLRNACGDCITAPCTYYEEEKLRRCFKNFKTYVLK